MGFRSEAAQFVAKKCSDNHKAWQMILIFYIGSLKELIVTYLRDVLSGVFPRQTPPFSTSHPSAEGFFSYCKSKRDNPNFMYLVEQVTTYCQAIVNLRMAMRRNNQLLSLSATHKISEIFHGRNHPFYRTIALYSLSNFLSAPKEVNELLSQNFTISLTDDTSKGEDWDFILENINKVTQRWIPKGVQKQCGKLLVGIQMPLKS